MKYDFDGNIIETWTRVLCSCSNPKLGLILSLNLQFYVQTQNSEFKHGVCVNSEVSLIILSSNSGLALILRPNYDLALSSNSKFALISILKSKLVLILN